jgi:hypothetical protein
MFSTEQDQSVGEVWVEWKNFSLRALVQTYCSWKRKTENIIFGGGNEHMLGLSFHLEEWQKIL